MFWIPYIRRQGATYTAGCSPDPQYDLAFFGPSSVLWRVTYPLPTAYAVAVTYYLQGVTGQARVGLWRLTFGANRLLREFGLPAKARLIKVERAAHSGLNLEPAQFNDAVVQGRLLTLRELVSGTYGVGHPIPRGFELVLQRALLTGAIELYPGIRLEPGMVPSCERCGSRRLIAAPCTQCGSSACLACEDCAELGLIRGCTPLFTAPQQIVHQPACRPGLAYPLVLTDPQEELVQRLLMAVGSGTGYLVDAVCGSGKGRMLLEVLRRLLLGEEDYQILVTTPRCSVLDEWSELFTQVLGAANLSILGGGQHRYRPGAPVTLATLPQLYRFSGAFNLVFVDEADAFPLGSDPQYWGVIKRAMTKNARLILLTATPQVLPGYFRQFPKISLPIRHHGKALPVPAMIACGSLDKMLEQTKCLVDRWIKTAGMRIFIFVPTKIIGKEVFSSLTKNGYLRKSCNFFYSGVEDYQAKLERFRSGKEPIAIATTVLERGLTVSPCAVVVFFADHPNLHEASLVQMAGRCGRSESDPTGEVVYLCKDETATQPRSACSHIRDVNLEAEKRGFLK